MSKKERCDPCKYFQDREEFYGLGCVKKGLQLGQMFIELCGEGNCAYFSTKVDKNE